MKTIQDTYTKFSTEPDTAKTSPAVTATLSNGFARATSGPFNWDIDLPGPLGGGNHSPSPTAYLLGALAGCAVTFINDTLAPEFGVEIDGLSATATCRADLAGLVGVPGTDPRLTGLSLSVEMSSPSPQEHRAEMWKAWCERCPIYLVLTEPVAVDLAFAG
jgi:uncharacterized OsmC-like protein